MLVTDMEHKEFAQESNDGFGDSFLDTMGVKGGTLQVATVLGRNKTSFVFPEGEDVPEVNGPLGAKGQYVWDGTYIIRLHTQGSIVRKAMSLASLGKGSNDQYIYAPQEEVLVTWLNSANRLIPVIIGGSTFNTFNKGVVGKAHLIDFGEKIVRAGISETSGEADAPFAYNQYDNPNSAPATEGTSEFDENSKAIVENAGGEVFLDKFGRVLSLSRQNSGHEFLVTNGKMDSGQDDVSSHKTTASQDTYYEGITDDESKPDDTDKSEPFAPKDLNLVQYQQIPKTGKLAGDTDATSSFNFGTLPRFDKWKFVPVVVRSYEAGTDGKVVDGSIYSVHNERGNCKYSRTITDGGDVKVFIPRHENVRVAGDSITSVGGNIEVKVKPLDRLATGATNPDNVYHSEILADGTVRIQTHENVSTSTFKSKIEISASGRIDIQSADKIYVGGEKDGTSELMAMGESLKTYIDTFVDTFLQSWVVVPTDGGAALKAVLATWASTANRDYLSDEVYVNKQSKVS